MKTSNLNQFFFIIVLFLATSVESTAQTKKEVEKHLTEQHNKYNKQTKVELKDSRGRKIYTERLRRDKEYVVEVKRNGRVVKTDTIKLDRHWKQRSKQR